MPNGIMNWSFDDVVDFLKQHHFVFAHHQQGGGSHDYYRGLVDGKQRLVEIQYHAGEAIKPKTLKLSIIRSSGVPEEM